MTTECEREMLASALYSLYAWFSQVTTKFSAYYYSENCLVNISQFKYTFLVYFTF